MNKIDETIEIKTSINEEILLNILKYNVIEDLEKLPGKYNEIDCYTKKYDTKIELKCRNSKYVGGMIIEKQKYEALMKSKKCRYINSVPDNAFNFNVYSWYLKKLPEPLWRKEKLPSDHNKHME